MKSVRFLLPLVLMSLAVIEEKPKREEFASYENSVLIQREIKDDLVRLVRTTALTISHGRNKALRTDDGRLSANRVLIPWLTDSDP